MKKLAVLAVIGLFVSAAAFAEVIVTQNGKTVTYEQGTPVMTSGDAPAQILYDGVEIKVPQGQKVLISKAKDGKVLITGTDLVGVEVGKEVISSKGLAVFSAAPNAKIDQIKGEITVINVNADQAVQKEAQKAEKEAEKEAKKEAKEAQKAEKSAKTVTSVKTTNAAAVQELDFPVASEYVNEVVSQQTAQDVECLSPSSPRGGC